MNNLKALTWHKDSKVWTAYGAGICYTITGFDGVINVTINNLNKQSKGEPRSSDSKTFTSYTQALDFVEHEHYPHFMSEFLKPQADSVGDHFDNFTQWANDRQIIQNGNVLAQGLKLVSEIGELADNLAKGRCIKDDIGDCMVVLNNLAQMTNTPLNDCLAQAWGDIKDRAGTMNEHGIFIKDGDL